MAILIGSRAWDLDYEDSFLRSDWDVVMNKQDFVNLLNGGYVLDISYDSLDNFKYRVKQHPKRVLEIELEEAFRSTKLLSKLREKGSQAVEMGTNTSAYPVTPLTCVVLKASHVTFPIHWRKTASQLAMMKTWFKSDSLQSLISSDVQCSLFKQLLDVRSREALARVLIKTKTRAVNNASLKEKKSLLYNQQEFNKFAPNDQSDAIYFPTTDTSVSRTKFSSGSLEYKLEVVQRQLELIAGIYFVDHPALSQLSPDARVKEIYLVSLQTFCCQQVPSEVPFVNQHSLIQKTYHVYQRYRAVPPRKEQEVKDFVKKISEMNVKELPLATDEQVSASPLGNHVIQWLVDHWTESILTPSPSFKEFVGKHSSAVLQRENNIVLPLEMMEMIFEYIDEHVTYCSLIGVNKYYRTLYNSDEAWKKLTHKCWSEDQIAFSKTVAELPPVSKKEKRKQQRARWQQIFAEIYQKALKASFVLCGHCHMFHDTIAHGRVERDEAYWEHCPCEQCDAESWYSCEFADEYTWED